MKKQGGISRQNTPARNNEPLHMKFLRKKGKHPDQV